MYSDTLKTALIDVSVPSRGSEKASWGPVAMLIVPEPMANSADDP